LFSVPGPSRQERNSEVEQAEIIIAATGPEALSPKVRRSLLDSQLNELTGDIMAENSQEVYEANEAQESAVINSQFTE
jgi:hypothetical protein